MPRRRATPVDVEDMIAEALESVELVDMEQETAPRAIPTPRKPRPARDDSRTGRSAFAGNECKDHGSDCGIPECVSVHACGKFGHLPGKGRGVKQPNIFQILWSIAKEMVKPLALLAFLLGAVGLFYVSFGNLVQPGNSNSGTTCTMPDGSSVSTPAGYVADSVTGACREYRGSLRVPADPAVTTP